MHPGKVLKPFTVTDLIRAIQHLVWKLFWESDSYLAYILYVTFMLSKYKGRDTRYIDPWQYESAKRVLRALPPRGLFSGLTGGLLSLNRRPKHCQELFLEPGHKLNWEDTSALRRDSCHHQWLASGPRHQDRRDRNEGLSEQNIICTNRGDMLNDLVMLIKGLVCKACCSGIKTSTPVQL